MNNKKRNSKKYYVLSIVFSICFFILTGCDKRQDLSVERTTVVETTEQEDDNAMIYSQITMKEAKEIFEEQGDYIIVDVRRPDEYADGHIPNAINIPNENIGSDEIPELPDKNQTIYVYCRSGNRSKQAAKKLVELGYTDIIEFGGILDWTGDRVKE